MVSKRLYGAALMAAVVIPALMQGCSSDNPLCCTEYSAGATVDVKIGGNAQAQVAVQAVGDFSAIASAAVDDITTACRNIATDLDVAQADRTAAEALTDKRARLKQYCSLAVTAIGKAAAGVSIQVNAKPPVCEVSIDAKAQCQAQCTGTVGGCDFTVHPVTCSGGGDLTISCEADCSVTATKPTIQCEGSCQASCTGSCTVNAGASVECAGRCNGTCAASASGSGSQADGTCKGSCSGTCEIVAPSAKCTGSCKGGCTGTCSATGGIKAKCDGSCSAKFEPISCSGGNITGGCTPPDVKCDANCDASVKAKAQCTPGDLTVTIAGAGALQATLEANLPKIFEFKSRLEGMATLTGTITGNADAVVSIKAACIPVVIASAADAVEDVTASVSATASIVGTVVTPS